MLIKTADDKTPQLQALEALLQHPDASPAKRQEIEAEVRRIRTGAKGEAQSAYEIDFYLKDSKNWAVIHDLRLECNGRVAQIDHLLINRFLCFYVLETKHFNADLQINEQGEFTAWYAKKPYGIPSPLEQNDKHIHVLRTAVLERLALPTRLGVRLSPSFESVVMVSKDSRITRPKQRDTHNVIKADHIYNWLQKDLESESILASVASLAKVVSGDTVQELAIQLARWHRPGSIDYKARFGLRDEVAHAVSVAAPVAVMAEAAVSVAPVAAPMVVSATEGGSKGKMICAVCDSPVTYAVAKFCWFNKGRFGGRVYCMEHQKGFGAQ